MHDKPLPIPESEKPVGSTYSPEVQRHIQANAIKRSMKHLFHSMSVLENGLHSHFRIASENTSNHSEVVTAEPPHIQEAISETRSLAFQILGSAGKRHLLKNPARLDTPSKPKLKSSSETTRTILAGLTGCRNAIRSLLEHEESAIKEVVGGSTLGQRALGRLASLLSALDQIKTQSPNEIDHIFHIKPKKPIHIVPKPSIPKIKKPRLTPIGTEKAKIVLELIEKNQRQFQTETIYDLAREIVMIIEDEGTGPTFKELRELFECSDQELKKSLISLKSDLRHLNISLMGAFKPHSSFPINIYV